MTRIILEVNGTTVDAEVAPRTHLADFLREQLLLTGTHIGCEHGICGACTVEINGEIARSCITYAVTCDGARVRTIEGFEDDELMAQLRRAFTEEHALQCGYCTPGMLIAARDLVRRKRDLTRPAIRTEMSGNLCRCTGYMGIINAIERVMRAQPAEAASQRESDWLGPAPGPTSEPSVERAKTPVPTKHRMRPAVTRSAAAAIEVTVSPFEQTEDGATSFTETFTLPHAVDAVWQLMGDVEAVARCMPGMSVDPVQGDRVSGRMQVNIGPISAAFAGEGRIQRFQSEHRQRIEAHGNDRRSGSRVTGAVDYKLTSIETEATQPQTRVDVVMRYTLAGPLASFGRSAIARDLARRIGETFAGNVSGQLADPSARIEAAPLSGLSLLWRAFAEQLRIALAKILPARR